MMRMVGVPRFVPLMMMGYVFVSHLVVTTYYTEFKRDQKLREKQLQVCGSADVTAATAVTRETAPTVHRFTPHVARVGAASQQRHPVADC